MQRSMILKRVQKVINKKDLDREQNILLRKWLELNPGTKQNKSLDLIRISNQRFYFNQIFRKFTKQKRR